MNNYSFQRKVDDVLIFTKYLGDNEIILEYNINTKRTNKFINDFRKKVQVDLENEDYDFINSLKL